MEQSQTAPLVDIVVRATEDTSLEHLWTEKFWRPWLQAVSTPVRATVPRFYAICVIDPERVRLHPRTECPVTDRSNSIIFFFLRRILREAGFSCRVVDQAKIEFVLAAASPSTQALPSREHTTLEPSSSSQTHRERLRAEQQDGHGDNDGGSESDDGSWDVPFGSDAIVGGGWDADDPGSVICSCDGADCLYYHPGLENDHLY